MKIYSSISSSLLIVLCILNSEAMDEFPSVMGFDNKTSIFDFSPISQAKEDAECRKFFF